MTTTTPQLIGIFLPPGVQRQLGPLSHQAQRPEVARALDGLWVLRNDAPETIMARAAILKADVLEEQL